MDEIDEIDLEWIETWRRAAQLQAERRRRAAEEHARRHRELYRDFIARMEAMSRERREAADALSVLNVVQGGQNEAVASDLIKRVRERVKRELGFDR